MIELHTIGWLRAALSEGAQGVGQLISQRDAAELLGVRLGTIRRMISRGDLRAYRIAGGRTVRIDADDLVAAMAPISPPAQ